jgi:hypothetical protein
MVVLDASWTRAAHRELARDLAYRTHSDLVELRCQATAANVQARLRHRSGGTSDADARIAEAMATRADPWPQAVPIRTDGPPEAAVSDALAVIHTGARSLPPTRPQCVRADGDSVGAPQHNLIRRAVSFAVSMVAARSSPSMA